MHDTQLTFWHYLLFAVVIYMAFYYGLGSYPLANNNEGLYAEVAREMWVTGNYLIPHLNFVPYIEKPPLLYWLIAGSNHLLGSTAFSARVIPALSATGVCLAILGLGQKIQQRYTGWLASLILATSLGFSIVGRIVFFDMLLCFCLTCTLLGFYLWYVHNKIAYLRIAYIFLALGILTKGLVCLALVCLISLSFLLIVKQPRKILQLLDPLGLLLFFAIVIPWHILANIRQPGFLWDFLVNEQFLRFLAKRQPHDYYSGPIYYYIPRLLIYLFPWTILTPLLAYRVKQKSPTQKSLECFLWLWFLIPLIFFSISEAKANYYMIVGVPPLAYLLSMRLNSLSQIKQHLRIFLTSWILLTGFAVTIVIFCQNSGLLATVPLVPKICMVLKHWSWLLLLYCVGVLIVGLVMYRQSRQVQQQHTNFLTLWIMGFSIGLLFLAAKVLPIISDDISEIRLSEYINTNHIANQLYIYEDYTKISTLLFYVQQRLPIINNESPDLYYGSATSAAKGWFLSEQEFMQQAKNKTVYVVFPNEDLADFQKLIQHMHFCKIAHSGDAMLWTNEVTFSNNTPHPPRFARRPLPQGER